MASNEPAPGRRLLAIAIVLCIALVIAGIGANAASRQGCQAIGPDPASCTFVVTQPSTIQVVAAAAQYWEVDISIGSFSGL